MDGTKTGMTAAMAALGAGDVLGEDEQLDLLEPDAALPLPPAVPAGNAGRGRPKGVMNKRTREMVDYLLSRYRSPLVGLLETYTRSPKELAKALELYVVDAEGHVVEGELRPGAVAEAFRIQQAAMVAALPYLHQKQPVAIETDGKGLGVLILGELNDGGAVSDELDAGIVDIEANQPVSDRDDEKSDNDGSDSDAK